MIAHVTFQNFGHQAVHRTACRGDQPEDVATLSLGVERSSEGIDLPADASDAMRELLPLPDGVGHFSYYTLVRYLVGVASRVVTQLEAA